VKGFDGLVDLEGRILVELVRCSYVVAEQLFWIEEPGCALAISDLESVTTGATLSRALVQRGTFDYRPEVM
jgi:hypothetical protein